MNTKHKELLIGWAVVSCGALLLALHSAWYYPFFSDDAFISLVYAKNLLAGKGLTWTDGSHVEGYSNLLWTLGTAGISSLGVNLVTAGRILCFVSGIGILAGCWTFGRKYYRDNPEIALGAVALTAASGPIAAWAQGGLEATLHAALLLWVAVILADPNARWKSLLGAGTLLAGLTLNRPEGALLAPMAAIGWWLAKRANGDAPTLQQCVNLALLVVLPSIAAAQGQLIFRLAYYHEWLPNTFHAKFALSAGRAESAWEYLKLGAKAHLPLLGGIAGGALWAGWVWYRNRKTNPSTPIPCATLIPAATLAATWIGMVALGGGDIFPAWRHLVPVIPLAIVICCGLAHIALQSGFGRIPIAAALCGVTLAGLIRTLEDGESLRARTEMYPWWGKPLAESLHSYWKPVSPPPVIAVTCAGALSFYSELPTLDMHGLNDRNLTRNKSDRFGKGQMGHELVNLDYVMSRRPDVIIAGVGGPTPEWGMDNHPEFRPNYMPVRLPPMPGGLGIEPGREPVVFIRKDRWNELQHPSIEALDWNGNPLPRIDPYHPVINLGPETIVSRAGGPATSVQWMQNFGRSWTKDDHTFLSFKEPNQEIILKFPGNGISGEVKLALTQAPDFGNVLISLNGSNPVEFKGYAPSVRRAILNLGNHTLQKENLLKVTLTGKEPDSKGTALGVDHVEWGANNPNL